MDMFGVSAASSDDEATRAADHVARNYKPMSSQDVHEMFGGLNSYERFTTAQYHRLRARRGARKAVCAQGNWMNDW